MLPLGTAFRDADLAIMIAINFALELSIDNVQVGCFHVEWKADYR